MRYGRATCQVAVLTEERDVARSHEEELFAKLTDRTDDLEALQESYVSLTDRHALVMRSPGKVAIFLAGRGL